MLSDILKSLYPKRTPTAPHISELLTPGMDPIENSRLFLLGRFAALIGLTKISLDDYLLAVKAEAVRLDVDMTASLVEISMAQYQRLQRRRREAILQAGRKRAARNTIKRRRWKGGA